MNQLKNILSVCKFESIFIYLKICTKENKLNVIERKLKMSMNKIGR